MCEGCSLCLWSPLREFGGCSTLFLAARYSMGSSRGKRGGAWPLGGQIFTAVAVCDGLAVARALAKAT